MGGFVTRNVTGGRVCRAVLVGDYQKGWKDGPFLHLNARYQVGIKVEPIDFRERLDY